MLRLTFDDAAVPESSVDISPVQTGDNALDEHRNAEQLSQPGFGEEASLAPTWSEDSLIFHTTEKCTRLQAIRRNRRVTGKPGARAHCQTCIAIAATRRSG